MKEDTLTTLGILFHIPNYRRTEGAQIKILETIYSCLIYCRKFDLTLKLKSPQSQKTKLRSKIIQREMHFCQPRFAF